MDNNLYKFLDENKVGRYISPTHPQGNRATRRANAHPIHSNNKKDTPGRKWNINK